MLPIANVVIPNFLKISFKQMFLCCFYCTNIQIQMNLQVCESVSKSAFCVFPPARWVGRLKWLSPGKRNTQSFFLSLSCFGQFELYLEVKGLPDSKGGGVGVDVKELLGFL